MTFQQKLTGELKALGLTTLYFALWLGLLMLLKVLVLEQYHIEFRGLSAALVGALVLSKVVLLLEHVPLGAWIRKQPTIIDVILRATFYGVGVFLVMVLEKAFETRHEFGGFGLALKNVFKHPDMPHIWANAICILWALVGFNVLSVVRRHLGGQGFMSLFLSRPVAYEPATGKRNFE